MRRILILLAIAVGVSGCGTTTMRTLSFAAAPVSPPAGAAASPPAAAAAASIAPVVTPNAGGQSGGSYAMPASSTPTHCSVWLRGRDAEIFFSATSLDVSPTCWSWIESSASNGEQWIDDQMATYPYEQIICSLQDGNALAQVEDEAGGRYGQKACSRLILGGWTQTATGG